jgi:hypothetical protein
MFLTPPLLAPTLNSRCHPQSSGFKLQDFIFVQYFILKNKKPQRGGKNSTFLYKKGRNWPTPVLRRSEIEPNTM